MSGPYGPNDPGEGRNDPTQVWGGQQAPGGAGPTQQWGGQNPPSQPTQQWGDPNQQAQQQWSQTPGQPQQQWGQPAQPQQQWGQTPGQPQAQWGQPAPAQQWGQPAQPQQQWGQPGQQPPRSGGGKKGLIIGLAAVGVLVLGGIVALVLLLTATDKLDQAAVQDGVKQVLTDSYGITDVSDVSCPSGQKVEVDATFECTLKVSGEQKKVNIKITKDDGTYEVGRPN
ncbi:DUF4333 domain-containing protein [Nocardia farcinica]|uniref:DUF4333 domain-containing protein n=1 Tax=Nocardia farcinica TaxID=37329 RepID=UPI000BF74995|nr:DUF4333 domain-containing protein [Nocardia farcinica]MBA4856381.1 DUF4333 domain-containing protein [Nocardia farcinica]MBC9814207.1 DUF4333 domain-containing protein [Nocardia farcinica]